MTLPNTSPAMLDEMLMEDIAALSIEELANLQAQIKSDTDLAKSRKEKLQQALIFKCGPTEKEKRQDDKVTIDGDGFSGVCRVPIENQLVKITRSIDIKCDQIYIVELVNSCPDIMAAKRIIPFKYSVSRKYWEGADEKVIAHLSPGITITTKNPVFDLSKVGEKL